MGQIIINYVSVFIIPLIVGAGIRIVFFKWNKGYLITIANFILFIIAVIAAIVIPNHGSEFYGLTVIRTVWLTIGSLMSGRIAKGILK